MTTPGQIDGFCSYFSRQVEIISNLNINQENLQDAGPEDQQIRFYQKVLIVTALDTLAGIRFPKKNYPDLHKQNRKRFVRFTTEYGGWEHGPLVSTPFLSDRLKKMNVRNGNLLDYLGNKLDQHDPQCGSYYEPTEFDETPDILLPHAKTEKEEEAIWYCQHFAILYRYRNFLVHEARVPGYGMDGVRNDENGAFYHGYIGRENWHLAYPVELFIMLLTNSINNLKAFFMEQNQNPFEFVGDTTRW